MIVLIATLTIAQAYWNTPTLCVDAPGGNQVCYRVWDGSLITPTKSRVYLVRSNDMAFSWCVDQGGCTEIPSHDPQPARDAKGRIARSESAKNAFKKTHPCPANGNRRGACPGYVIDHVLPLACGGKDAPENMQWQTTVEGKKKDRWELSLPGCPAKFSKWQRIRRSLNPGEK